MPVSGEDVVLEDFVAAVGFGVAWVDAADDVDLGVDAHYAAMMPRLRQVRSWSPLLQPTIEHVHVAREPVIVGP